jgi:hypothetical protein
LGITGVPMASANNRFRSNTWADTCSIRALADIDDVDEEIDDVDEENVCFWG